VKNALLLLAILSLIAGGLLTGACSTRGSPQPAPPVPARAGAPAPDAAVPGILPDRAARDRGDRVVAVVGTREIRESDIGEFVIRYFRDRANEALTHLIDTIMLTKEAEALGIHVPPDLLREQVEEQLTARQRTIHTQFGTDVSLESYLEDRYGITLAEHRQDLGELVQTRMLRDRVIRFSQLREDRFRVRDAVFADKETASRAAVSARDGADLDRIAKESGIAASQVLPPLTAVDFTPVELGLAAVALDSGGVSDPVPVKTPQGTVYHVLKLVSREPARAEDWDVLRIEIEAGIKSRAVEQWEYTLWARKMRERYQARVLR